MISRAIKGSAFLLGAKKLPGYDMELVEVDNMTKEKETKEKVKKKSSQNSGKNSGAKNLTPFQPGKSGNPGGRPKMPEEIKMAFRAASEDACNVLIKIANDPHAKEADRIRAAECILDRGFGKPTQALEVETTNIPQIVFKGVSDVAD